MARTKDSAGSVQGFGFCGVNASKVYADAPKKRWSCVCPVNPPIHQTPELHATWSLPETGGFRRPSQAFRGSGVDEVEQSFSVPVGRIGHLIGKARNSTNSGSISGGIDICSSWRGMSLAWLQNIPRAGLRSGGPWSCCLNEALASRDSLYLLLAGAQSGMWE